MDGILILLSHLPSVKITTRPYSVLIWMYFSGLGGTGVLMSNDFHSVSSHMMILTIFINCICSLYECQTVLAAFNVLHDTLLFS